MAQSLVQQKTYAETAAIFAMSSSAYNLAYAGTIIYVTDKDWHLLCYKDRVAKPLSGVLKITNGDTLPAWLTPELIEVNFGTITSDISVTGIEIDLAATYYPIMLVAKNIDSSSELGPIYVLDNNGLNTVRFTSTFFENESCISRGSYVADSFDGIKIAAPYVLMATGNSGSGFQAKVLMQLLPAF